MASMNGISIKHMHSFKTMEGIAWQGEIYLAGKKIGEWSNDAYRGPDLFRMEEGYGFEKLTKKLSLLYPEWNESPAEYFMFELMKLTNREKQYKSLLTDYSCDVQLVMTDGSTEIGIGLPESSDLTDQMILLNEKDHIAKLNQKLNPENVGNKHQVLIYRDLEQFSVGEEIRLEDIMMIA